MPSPVLHFEIAAREPDRLQDFYRQAFEWKIDADNPMNYGLVDTGSDDGIRGGIGPAGDSGGGPTFYIAVGDLDAALARISELGGKTLMEPSAVPGGPTIALFADPEGNRIGLLKA
ncbi:MAG TPA: VOC family protein [Solirubrobacteraceae bacterium]|jgi:hypothetical protein|nr:VOC family protein [Solirubrobacteraceae bacterium]